MDPSLRITWLYISVVYFDHGDFLYIFLEQKCEEIFSPINGEMTCTVGMSTGSVCSFSCEDGFKLNGKDAVVCQNSLTWTFSAPVCESMFVFIFQLCVLFNSCLT